MSRCAPRRKIGRSPVPETARSSYDGKGVRATPHASGSDLRLSCPGSAGSARSTGSTGSARSTGSAGSRVIPGSTGSAGSARSTWSAGSRGRPGRPLRPGSPGSAGNPGSPGSPGSRGRGVLLLGATDGKDEKHHAHDTQHHGASAHFEIPPSGSDLRLSYSAPGGDSTVPWRHKV
jgi:hypothetical protein